MQVTLCDGLENCEDYSIELTVNEAVEEIAIEIVIEEEVEEFTGNEVEEVVEEVLEEKPEPLTVSYKGISKSGEIVLKFS